MLTLPRNLVDHALRGSGLEPNAIGTGGHPDDGFDCLYLKATIQQYSLFLVTLTDRMGHGATGQWWRGSALTSLANGVQPQTNSQGDVTFWLPGVRIEASSP